MSITAGVTNYIRFSGDQASELIYATGALADSPALQELVTLAIGNNAVTVPSVDDFTVHGVVIVPPAGNTEDVTIKGVNGDTGISLSDSKASVIQFGDTPPASIVLNVAAEVVGLRLVWF